MYSSYTYTFAQGNQTAVPTYEFWNPAMQAIAKPNSKPGWIYFKDDFTTPPEQIFTLHKEAFGLGVDDSMLIYKEVVDEFGIEHSYYKRFFNNIEIYNSFLHFVNVPNGYKYLSGHIKNLPFINESNQNFINMTISDFDSIDNIIEIYYLDNFNFELSLMFETYDSLNRKRSIIFSQKDGQIKEIINDYSHACIESTPQEACTKQGGVNSVINIIENTGMYELTNDCYPTKIMLGVNETCTGWNCTVYNLEHTTNDLSCSNEDLLNMIWSAENVYNYFTSVHNPNAEIGYGSELTIEWLPLSTMNLAVYEGSKIRLCHTFGKLDIIGHEMTHGLLKLNSTIQGGIGTMNTLESMAIQESFCDIMAISAEHFTLGNQANWYIAENTRWGSHNELSNEVYEYGWRCIKKPNSVETPMFSGNYTYSEITWLPSSNWQANQGLYYPNGQVLSYWYYLLCEGDEGINNDGYVYNVNAIGMHKAEKLIYNTILNNLTNIGTGFYELKSVCNQVALDLYSIGFLTFNDLCAIQDAWRAIGVYNYEEALIYLPNTDISNYFIDWTSVFYNDNVTFSYENINYEYSDVIITNGKTVTYNFCDIYIGEGQKIIIEEGATLKANRSNFYFGENAFIIVKTGGKIDFGPSEVQLNKSSNQHSCSSSTGFWKGIIVEDLLSGKIEMNNTTIENAEMALEFKAQTFTPNVLIENSNFINNKQSFVHKENTVVTQTNSSHSTTPTIKNTQFTINNNFPIYNNGFIHNLINTPQIQATGLSGFIISENSKFQNNTNYVVDAIKVEGNLSFLNSSISNYRRGIILKANHYNFIHNSTFSNFSIAIDVIDSYQNTQQYLSVFTNTFSSLLRGKPSGLSVKIISGPQLKTSIMSNTFTNVQKGLYTSNSSDILVSNNTFNLPAANTNNINPNVSNPDHYGVFLTGCNGFLVDKNNFTLNGVANNASLFAGLRSYGVIIDQSPSSGSGAIANNNFFTGTQGINNLLANAPTSFAIQTQGFNERTNIRCNTFTITNTQLRGIKVASGTLANQGVGCGSNAEPAGNEWTDNCAVLQSPWGIPLNGKLDIYRHPDVPQFDYWAHNANAQGLATTRPNCNNLGQGMVKICDGVSLSDPNDQQSPPFQFQIKDTLSCTDPFLGLKMLGKSAESEMDISDILYSQIPEQQQAKNTLLTQLSNLQSQLTNPNEQKGLVDKIDYTLNEIFVANKNLANLFLQANMEYEAKQLLEQDSKIEAKMELVQIYLSKGNTADAERVLDEIILAQKESYFFSNETIEDQYYWNKTYFADVAEIENNMLKQERDSLTESEVATLTAILNANLPISAHAEYLLLLQYPEMWDERLIVKVEEEYTEEFDSTLLFDYQLVLTPNPASGIVEASFVVPNGVTQYTLKVLDSYQNIGQLKYQVNKNEIVSAQFDTSTWGVGTYTVALIINDEVVETTHLLVLR